MSFADFKTLMEDVAILPFLQHLFIVVQDKSSFEYSANFLLICVIFIYLLKNCRKGSDLIRIRQYGNSKDSNLSGRISQRHQ